MRLRPQRRLARGRRRALLCRILRRVHHGHRRASVRFDRWRVLARAGSSGMCVARAELQLLALAARLGIAGAKPFKRGDAVCESLSGRSVLGAEVGTADAARSGSSMSIRKTSSSSPAKPRRFMVDCTGRWKASALGRRKSEVPVGGLARGSTAARGSAAAPRSRLSGREPIFFARNPQGPVSLCGSRGS